MKAIMVMFDSLNRRMLPPYGCAWTHAPNFARLAERTVTFDNSYVGSMPCMPARREMHTGRYNFLHRSWGPLEPFDHSLPEILSQNGIYTHLVSDHYHYWEDGGGTYHNRYNSWQFPRGQEGDPWIGQVADPETPETLNQLQTERPIWRQDWINRAAIDEESKMPQAVTFATGIDFIERNHTADNWFLQIETFDPHEPFYTQQAWKDLYPHDYDGPHFDWPDYRPVEETPEQVAHLRLEYAALLSMCDHYLGKVLDAMDEHNLWEDTLLVVCTDHGFLLSEHDWWAKCVQPFYNEVAHTPLFLWDPRCGVAGEHRQSLAQLIDLPPTLLDFFGVDIPAEMLGQPLHDTLRDDSPAHPDGILFGMHGAHVNYTDGRYIYMRAPARPENIPLYQYTMMPTHMNKRFALDELADITIGGPFDWTQGRQVMKIGSPGSDHHFVPGDKTEVQQPAPTANVHHQFGTLLFDLDSDPGQEQPLDDPALEADLIRRMVKLMQANECPPEQFERLGIQEYV
ncbi:sulfatase [Chloroflexota bacterium]